MYICTYTCSHTRHKAHLCTHMYIHMCTHMHVHTFLHFIYCVVMCKYLSLHKSSLLFSIIVAFLRSERPHLGIHLATAWGVPWGTYHLVFLLLFRLTCTLLLISHQGWSSGNHVYLFWGSLMRLVLEFHLFSDTFWVSLPRVTEAFGGLQGQCEKVLSSAPSQRLVFFLECAHFSFSSPLRLAQAGHAVCL